MVRTHAAVALLVAVAGCLDEAPRPDISDLRVSVRWSSGGHRTVEVSVPEIPCVGTESGFLGEEGDECVSAPWNLVIDGASVETTPVSCTAAHDGLFGPVAKRCTGGRVSAPLSDSAGEDVELVASTDADERRVTLHGVRRTHAWVAEAPFRNTTEPGVVRVDDFELGFSSFIVWLTPPDGGAPIRGTARRAGADVHRLELLLDATSPRVNGVYTVRVEAYAHEDVASVAIPPM